MCIRDGASTAPALREQHGRGEAYHALAMPDLVVFPVTTQEVADIVRACAAAGVPIVPFGAGTPLAVSYTHLTLPASELG